MRRLGGANRRVEIQPDIGPGLLRFLAAAVAEDHAVGDDDRLAALHVRRHPDRREIELAVAIAQPEAAHAAGHHRAVRDLELELRVHRSPERRQDPSVADRILPGRQRAPAAGVLKVDFLVAEQIALVERRLIVGSAGRLRIEQEHAALFARRGDQLPPLVGEDGRRIIRIEIAFLQPRPILRREVALQLQLVPHHVHADDAVAVARRIRGDVVDAVAGREPCGSARIDRRPTPAPRAAASGVERHHLVPRIVHLHRGDADPGVGVRHPQHVADQVERPAFADVEHVRRFEIAAVGGVHDVQHPVAGDEIDRAAALCVGGPDDRRVAAATGPQEPEARRIGVGSGGRPAGRSRCRVVPVLLPQGRPRLDVERIEVVGDAVDDADLARAVRGVQPSDDQHGHQRMQRPDLVARLNLPEDLQVPHVLLREDGFVALPAGALVVVAVGHPVHGRRAAALCARVPHGARGKGNDDRPDDSFHVVPRSQCSSGIPKAYTVPSNVTT